MLDYKDFNEDNIFQDGNVIELRNGAKYEILETVFVNCYESNKRFYALSLTPEYVYKLHDFDWDYYGFYGRYSSKDIIKVYDKEGHMLMERLHLNPNCKYELVSYDDRNEERYFGDKKVEKQRGIDKKHEILEWHRENNAEKRIRRRIPIEIP